MDIDLLRRGELSPEVIENLRQADPEEMRAMLAELLPDDEVDEIMGRVEELRRGERQRV